MPQIIRPASEPLLSLGISSAPVYFGMAKLQKHGVLGRLSIAKPVGLNGGGLPIAIMFSMVVRLLHSYRFY